MTTPNYTRKRRAIWTRRDKRPKRRFRHAQALYYRAKFRKDRKTKRLAVRLIKQGKRVFFGHNETWTAAGVYFGPLVLTVLTPDGKHLRYPRSN